MNIRYTYHEATRRVGGIGGRTWHTETGYTSGWTGCDEGSATLGLCANTYDRNEVVEMRIYLAR
jgi:hypothetical protein